MKNKNLSFVKYCVLYLSLYSIMLFLPFIILNSIIERKINSITFEIENIGDYKEYLDQDNFRELPIKQYKKNEIIVFDENDKIIFETHNYENNYISPKEFEFIDDFSADTYFWVQKLRNNKQIKYIITKNSFGDDLSDTIISYCIVDSSYKIIEGDLFKEKSRLTEREFNLLKNGLNGKSKVSKYVYTNINNKKRTLLLYQKNISTKEYIKISKRIKSGWFIIIPIIVVETIFIIYLFYKRIKKILFITKKRILDCEANNVDDIPDEFKDFYIHIKDLLNSLEKERIKRMEEEKSKQSIITNLSHDIKTPLTVIQGYAKAFDDELVPKDKEKQYMRAIYDKAILATDIINSLFEYSKMDHYEYKPTFKNENFTEFCREYLAIKYTDLEVQGYKLNYNIEENDYNYNFDKTLITRLFDNIINNSVKHNKRGTTIYFEYKISNNKIIVNISDNGKGLSIKEVDKLFDAFVVENSARTNGKGTGLGLYIAKRIVEFHNGEISIIKKPILPHKFEIEVVLK